MRGSVTAKLSGRARACCTKSGNGRLDGSVALLQKQSQAEHGSPTELKTPIEELWRGETTRLGRASTPRAAKVATAAPALHASLHSSSKTHRSTATHHAQ